jgi:hypothetical protein
MRKCCAEWLYYYLKKQAETQGSNITTQHNIFTLVLPTLVQTVLVLTNELYTWKTLKGKNVQ